MTHIRHESEARKRKLLRPALAILATAILAGAAFGVSRLLTEPAAPAAAAEPSKPAAQRCQGNALFGHIKSLTSRRDLYELRFDPAWFLSGETANTAAAEDGEVEPGQPVPNDNYVLEEGHRLLKLLVSPTAHVTVLARKAGDAGFGPRPISVAELAQLVGGEEPVELFEPLESGIWLRVHIDTACSVEQQYRP